MHSTVWDVAQTVAMVTGLSLTHAVVCSSSDEWRCDNGQCIDGDKRCDDNFDCDDRSDEHYSYCDAEPGGFISCKFTSQMSL